MPVKCPNCGAKMVEYRHTMSKALATGLYRLGMIGKAVNIKSLGLTRNQWDNFQKLRYWDLVAKALREDGKHIGGAWGITERGREFLAGKITVARAVWTYRGERVRYDAQAVAFRDVADPYETRPEYARAAKPHPKGDLFESTT